MVATVAFAQQSGTVVGTKPGSAAGKSLPSIQVPPPAPSCDTPGALRINMLGVPSMVFSRMMDYLVCLRQPDGQFEELLKAGPWTALSPAGDDVAYWLPEPHALHVYSFPNHTDTVVDTIPGANMRQIAWSERGRVLSYSLRGPSQQGIHVIDLDSGRRTLLEHTHGEIVNSPDPAYIVTVDGEAVRHVRVADGHSDVVARVPAAADAAYSTSGALLGILASDLKNSRAPASDDEPDCTGALFALFVQAGGSNKLVEVPFPKGFESVLDFAFAPDDGSIAVTFGAAACDYPGDVARVFSVSFPSLALKPLSPEDHLSVKAHWSPDGKMVIYSDYTPGELGLIAVDITTGKRIRLTDTGYDGPDELIGWRR